MADLLSSLGILSGPPDPKKLENQRELTKQTDEVKEQVKGLLGTLGVASQVAKMAGIPTDSIEAMQKEGAQLVSSTTLSPDQLEKKRLELEAKFEAQKAEQEEATRKALEIKLQDANKLIKDRFDTVYNDSSTSEGLRVRYETLLSDAKYTMKVFQDALVSPPTTPPDPVPKTVETLLDELEILNFDKEKEEDSTFNLGRVVRRTLLQMKTYLFYIIIGVGLLLGGSFCSNLYAFEKFVGIRLYYYVYGALLFPLVILWTIFRPPYLYSMLVPLVEVPNLNPDNRFEWFYSFERLGITQEEDKLGWSKSYARITSIAYTVSFSLYFAVFYGIDYVRDAIGSSGLF